MYRVIPLAGIETKCHMSATCLSVSRGRGFHLSLRFNVKGTFEDCLMTPQAQARRDVRFRVPRGSPNPWLTMAISDSPSEAQQVDAPCIAGDLAGCLDGPGPRGGL